MKKILSAFLAFTLGSVLLAQDCDLPPRFDGNTGSNMTVMLLPGFLTSLSATSEDAYVVALTPGGLLVGSADVYGKSQTSIAIWGDDTGMDSPQIDGAFMHTNLVSLPRS
mgnify:CR=1 FL=1